MQVNYSDNNKLNQQPHDDNNDFLEGDYDEEVKEATAKLEMLESFKHSWLYAEMISLFTEQYQALFNGAIAETNRDIRSDKLEQMKGVAYAMGVVDVIEEKLKQNMESE